MDCGQQVLFFSDRNGRSEIFKQPIDQPQPDLPVSSPENVFLPRLSPDGSEVLYLSTPQEAPPYTPASILASPVTGGVARKVLETKELNLDTKGVNLGNIECTRKPAEFCVIHSVEGTHVTFLRFDPRNGVNSQLTHLESDADVNWGLSPDGSYLAIVPYSPDSSSIILYSVAAGKMGKLNVKGWTGLTTLDWAADSKSMFIGTLDRSGHIALLRVTTDGNVHVLRKGMFPTLCGCAYWAIPSPDGKWAAINEPSGASNVWELDTN